MEIPKTVAEQPPLHQASELFDPSRGYLAKEGHRFAQGVRVIVAIDDAPADGGGFALMPASHKMNIEPPPAVRAGQDDLSRLGTPVIKQPDLAAGDVLLCVSTLGWTLRAPTTKGAKPPKLLHAEFVGNVSRPGGAAAFTEDMPWMLEMSEAERLVMGCKTPGSTTPAAVVVKDGVVVQGPPAAEYHPRRLEVDRQMDDSIDPDEQFFWELNGFLVLRHVMVR